MNWVKISDGFPAHPKVQAAGSRAAYLYVCGLCYSNQYLTDGRLPNVALPAMMPGVRDVRRLAERLVNVGLWERTSNGWQIHDYAAHQRTAAQIRADRHADRERKRRPESARNPPGIQPESDGNPVLARGEGEGEGEGGPPVVPPMGGRQRDQLRFRKQVSVYAAAHFPELEQRGREHAVAQAIRYGHASTLPAVRAYVLEHFPQLQPAGDPR